MCEARCVKARLAVGTSGGVMLMREDNVVAPVAYLAYETLQPTQLAAFKVLGGELMGELYVLQELWLGVGLDAEQIAHGKNVVTFGDEMSWKLLENVNQRTGHFILVWW